MTNKHDIFQDMHSQMAPRPEVLKELADKLEREQTAPSAFSDKPDKACDASGLPESAAAPHDSTNYAPLESLNNASSPVKRRRRWPQYSLAAAAVVAVLAFGLAVSLPMLNNTSNSTLGLLPPSTASNVASPNSYSDLYNSLKANVPGFGSAPGEESKDSSGVIDDSAPLAALTPNSADTSSPLAEAADTQNAATPDHSDTNTQVANVDEGDIVKTDGKNIYVLRNNEVLVVAAKGENSEEIARVSPQKELADDAYYSFSVSDIYLYGTTLALLYSDYGYSGWDSSNTYVALYDISNPADPQPINALGQDGYLTTSRVYDGVLYLISGYSIPAAGYAQEDTPHNYVPQLYSGTQASDVAADRLLAPGEICILPDYNSALYTIVSSVDLSTGKRIDTISTLGRTSTTYMSADNLFVAGTSTVVDEIVTPYNSQYDLVERLTSVSSHLIRFSLNKGAVSLEASATLQGSLLNQFSLDEYQGYLRVALTTSDSSFTFLRDKVTGMRDYSYSDPSTSSANSGKPSSSSSSSSSSGSSSSSFSPTSTREQSNSIVVLNSSLAIVGSIDGLAADERIYSVRFDGALGYMVTFRQVDPLFTIDLSNPRAPKVLSALKIPGFSQYLHVYGKGQLFGLGKDANSNTGRTTQGIKLSMFDTSDPLAVYEESKLLIRDVSSTPALTNHKAILVSSDHNLIGFGASYYSYSGSSSSRYSSEYLIYGYDSKKGFYERASILLKGSAYNDAYSARGLYIGDYFYVSCGAYLYVLDLDSLEQLATISLPVGETSGSGGGYSVYPLGIE